MENLDILEKLGKVAGIAGIAVGALVLIFGGIIQKNIFPGMTKEQGFRIIRMMIIAASLLAIFGIAAWVYTEFQSGKREKEASLITKSLIGQVFDQNGATIPNVKASIAQMPEILDKADQDGKFVLRLEGAGKNYFDLVFEHPQYQTVRKKVTVDFDAEGDELPVDRVQMNIVQQDALPNTAGNQENTPPKATDRPEIQNTGGSGAATINLFYNDEGVGCNLTVAINIGGVEFYPQSNPVQLLGLTSGYQNYFVSGTAICPNGGTCTVSGNGQLKIENGGQYYMVFDPYLTCVATIMNEADYQALINAVY
jgi:hypothetical protein